MANTEWQRTSRGCCLSIGLDAYTHLFKKILFMYLFLAVLGLSLVAASGGYSLLRCVGFSLQWPLLLQSTDSRVRAQ